MEKTDQKQPAKTDTKPLKALIFGSEIKWETECLN
jgi:hypothetical protein